MEKSLKNKVLKPNFVLLILKKKYRKERFHSTQWNFRIEPRQSSYRKEKTSNMLLRPTYTAILKAKLIKFIGIS
jgi:hypothetical protein